tara:strand:+ start:221794 stop:222048 length:255 start_codon:yes stop_codon:yes gene_type:complete
MRLLLIILVLPLSACANAPVGWGGSHDIVLANEKAITIAYDPIMGGYSKAMQAATEHCGEYDKSPVPTVSGKRGPMPTQTYECR